MLKKHLLLLSFHNHIMLATAVLLNIFMKTVILTFFNRKFKRTAFIWNTFKSFYCHFWSINIDSIQTNSISLLIKSIYIFLEIVTDPKLLNGSMFNIKINATVNISFDVVVFLFEQRLGFSTGCFVLQPMVHQDMQQGLQTGMYRYYWAKSWILTKKAWHFEMNGCV